MIEIKDKTNCSGCYACYNICPKSCITMKSDTEGFWYPEVDKNKCVNCDLCENVCPILHDRIIDNAPKAYACYNKDEVTRLKSSSGGIFSLIAKYVLKQKGVVFGASFDENFQLVHTYTESEDEIYKFRGSKYVQSKIGHSYSLAKKYLEDDRIVLFTGTPCQIDGLKSFLKKDYEDLITQDIVCHGVPSPKVWEKYKSEVAKGHKIINVSFRDKSKGWSNGSLKIDFDDGTSFSQLGSDNIYIRGFIKNLYLRPSCFDCHSKSIHRNSDITLADFWGIQNIAPELNDEKGISLILINSVIGQKILDDIKSKVVYKEVGIEDSFRYNPCAYQSTIINPKRDTFLRELDNISFIQLLKKFGNDKFNIRIKTKIKRLLNNRNL